MRPIASSNNIGSQCIMDNDYIDIVKMKNLGNKLNGDGEILSAQISQAP